MNLPNKLTVIRMCLVPVFLVFFYFESIPFNYAFALIIFAAASFTDMMDGRIARSRGLVTNFGKFLDPIADKILVCSALIAFAEHGMAFSISVILVVARDFIISGIRQIAAETGKVIAANIWGKIKTALQMLYIMISLLIAEIAKTSSSPNALLSAVKYASLAVAAVTLLSAIVYVKDNSSLLKG